MPGYKRKRRPTRKRPFRGKRNRTFRPKSVINTRPMARRTYAHRSDIAKFNYRATFVYSPAEHNASGLVPLTAARSVDGLRFSASDLGEIQGLVAGEPQPCFGYVATSDGSDGPGTVKFYRDDVVTMGQPEGAVDDPYKTKYLAPALDGTVQTYLPNDAQAKAISTQPELFDQWIGGTEGVHRYKRYAVLGSKITIRAVPEPQATDVATVDFRQEVANLYLGKCDKKASNAGQYIGAPGVENSSSRSNAMLRKLPFISSSQIRMNNVNEQAKNSVTMTATYSAKRMNGCTDAKDNKNLYGAYVGNQYKSPTDNHMFEFGIAPQFDGVQTLPGYKSDATAPNSMHSAYPKMRIRLHVFISYTCQLADPLATTNIPRPIMMSRPSWRGKAYKFAKGTVYKTAQNPNTWNFLQKMFAAGTMGSLGYGNRRAIGWR